MVDSKYDTIGDGKESVGANGKKMRRDPNMPKKPLSAYIYFSQETREQIKKENPKMPVSAIMKEVSNRWAAMSKEEKDPYVTDAREDKKRYEQELSKVKGKPTEIKQSKPIKETEEQPEEEYYEIDSATEEAPKKRRKHSDEESWSYSKKKSLSKKKSNCRVSIDLSTLDNRNKKSTFKKNDTPKMTPDEAEEPKFNFNPPETKSTQSISKNAPSPTLLKKESSGYPSSNFHPSDTNLTNIFSPTPFPINRSPGISPNMMARFTPFTPGLSEMNRDYSNRNLNNSNTPSLMGQSTNMNINRNDSYSNRATDLKNNVNYTPSSMLQSPGMNPFGNYGISSMSPSGFTPIRANFQKNSPMFFPANADYGQYFNTSPNLNSMSSQTFGYHRTPVNTLGRPNVQFQQKQNYQIPNNSSNQQNKGNNDEDIFALNPFGN